ncbi:MAG TPA: AMP-binding protein [Acidimicrobiales bacterium]|nr:AMP-binding protein [Acidimicrobiales bacterium]
MHRLVALAAEGGTRFPDRLRDAWEAGDAVLPVDPRLPRPAVDRLLARLAPDVFVDADGDRHGVTGGRPVEPGDALVVATSGSTGEPRGVVLTHDAVAASAVATSTRLGVDPGSDRWLACLPLAHVGGLSVVTRALATGTGLTIHDRFDAADVEEEARRGATLVSLVPTALRRIDSSLFRTVLLGGSRPPDDVGTNVVTTYGMTETGSGVVYDGVPLDGVEVRIADGEVQVRGPMLLRCYRDGDDPRTADGWLPTGDAGVIEDSGIGVPGGGGGGRLTVFGRRAEMIITGGENVWPHAVEEVLGGHPQVAEVAVAGRPDPEWGQRVAAWVVPVDTSRPPTLRSLRAWVAGQLPSYAAPRRLTVVDALPRTALGKIARHRLPGETE